MSNKLSVISIMVACLSLAGCQTVSSLAGKAPLSLAASKADAIEQYLTNGNASALAFSGDGRYAFSVSCPYGDCYYGNFATAEEKSIYECEKLGGLPCYTFAIGHNIVWQGPITMPTALKGKRLLRISKEDGPNILIFSGDAEIDPQSEIGKLRINIAGNACDGVINQTTGQWNLSCADGLKIAGSASPSDESLFWGLANGGEYEFSIARTGWPVLRGKLASLSRDTTNNDGAALSSALSGAAKTAFETYIQNDQYKRYKAFASDIENGAYGRTWSNPTPSLAIDEALRICRKKGNSCTLYAVGDEVVHGLSESERDRIVKEYRASLDSALPSDVELGQRLDPADIASTIVGKHLSGRSTNGIAVELDVRKNGELYMILHGTELSQNLSGPSTGKWWNDDEGFCYRVQRLYGNSRQCRNVFRNGEDIYMVTGKRDMTAWLRVTGVAQ